ncbi:MAG: hypothetical protein JXB39_12420 [Deltaproteobacteria bacterium]|nr:hypothetical protein [Deltaproteobacteria bacterium]
MPVGSDHSRGKGRRRPAEEARQQERTRQEAVRVARDRVLTQDTAARLQQAMGNQATRAALERPGAAGLASDDHAAREEEREQGEALESDESPAPRYAFPIPQRGLPAAPAAGIEGEYQYGGDDEDDPPLPLPDERPLLAIPSAGRGNRARLEALRASGRIAPTPRADPSPGSPGALGSATGPSSPSGDARFRSPLAAWGDPALLAGRPIGPEDLVDLAGPLDPLARPSLAAAFLSEQADDPLARAIARVVAVPPGALVAGSGSAAGQSALLAALAVLALACGPPEQAAVRDRAVELALDEDALEAILSGAGDLTRSVPSAYTLVGHHVRATGEPGPVPPLGVAARRWLVPALARAGRVAPVPEPPHWEFPHHEEPGDSSDPAVRVDRLLAEGAPAVLVAEAIAPFVEAIDALLAAGGRAQVEVAAAAVAGCTPGREAEAIRICKAFSRDSREMAGALLDVRKGLVGAAGGREATKAGARAATALDRPRDALVSARTRALEDLAALADPGALPGSTPDASTPAESDLLERAEALEAGARTKAAGLLLETALREAEDGGRRRLAGRLGLTLGLLRVRQGAASEAEARFLACIEAALDAEDTLAATAAGFLALSLARTRADWTAVADRADRVGRLAILRRNPAGLLVAADGHLAVALALGDPDAGLRMLVTCDRLLETLEETAARSLVFARVAEVRSALG